MRTKTPLLDLAAIILFLVAIVSAGFMGIVHFAPEVIAFARAGKVAPCSTAQVLRGLRTHRRATDAAPEIKRLSRLVQKDSAGYDQWSTPQGRFWIPEMTHAALWLLLGQQKLDIYDEGDAVVRPGDIVLDCGAHVGVFTRTALKRGAKLVAAIEPAPENVECLRRNFVDEIRAGRVLVYAKGAWNKDDIRPMHLNRNSAGDSFVLELDPGQKVIQLPLTTIDKIALELRLPRVDFIKMDIKGAEVQALEGARQT